jgi:hypothetical protein
VNGIRWTTGVGIAVGGVGGALLALLGAPAPAPPATAHRQEPVFDGVSATRAEVPRPLVSPVAADPPLAAVSASPATPEASAVALPLALPSAAVTAPSFIAPPALDVPTTRAALLHAEMVCDQKKDFDQCARAALALETGTTGPPDLEQAKRFRRIALTHLVAKCELDSPHACFVLAAKYRAGTELAKSIISAEALERRGAQLCRLGRPAPECPPP